ncbi:MAG: zinc transporter ZntB [Pseudomonas sp.]|nr:MAG: zinc transporter ZntB [Pseudomonas sp.]
MNQQDAARALVHAFVLDGLGGARSLELEQLDELQLTEQESLWLHWDRGHPQTRLWLREHSGLSEFSCDLLLEENTRPRLLGLPDQEFLLFLRGVNLNPGAEPEDMVSVRIFAGSRRVISLRQRPLRATEELIALLEQGHGPRNGSELVQELAYYLTEKVESLIDGLSDLLDGQEDSLDTDARFMPDHGQVLQARRRAAGLRRFLAPQREIFAQLVHNGFGDSIQWNELNNRLMRYLEELEMIRERVGLVLEAEHRRMNEKMNRAIYLLGVTTVFFLPMSFLTGLLGINVGGIPGAESQHGFLLICSILAGIGALQWWLFRRLRWL